MNPSKKIIITSRNNPDLEGVFLEHEVEKEMREVGTRFTPGDNEWMIWVFEHVFAEDDFTFTLEFEKLLAESEIIKNITLKLSCGNVTIEFA